MMSSPSRLTNLPREILTLIMQNVYVDMHVLYLIVPPSSKANDEIPRKFRAPMLINKILSGISREVFPHFATIHIRIERYWDLTKRLEKRQLFDKGIGTLLQFRHASGDLSFAFVLINLVNARRSSERTQNAAEGIAKSPLLLGKLEKLIVKDYWNLSGWYIDLAQVLWSD